MHLRVIATDYDWTIARDGVLGACVRSGIAKARQRGLLVVIVTGRILSELRSVAGCLDFFDGVVAENGAVFALPSGHVTRFVVVVNWLEGETLMASTSTNRGVVYKGQGKVDVEGIDFPKLVNPNGKQAGHGVILKIVATNICGSDQHMVRGRTTAPIGLVLGHEITGEVI